MSLANLLQKKDHPTPAIPTITQLLCGLVHLCEREVLHCDLKPSNILAMPDGRFVITDFGLAKRLHGGRVTTHGNFCYSMPYRPVEALAAGKDQAGPCPYQKLVQLNKLEHSCFLCPWYLIPLSRTISGFIERSLDMCLVMLGLRWVEIVLVWWLQIIWKLYRASM